MLANGTKDGSDGFAGGLSLAEALRSLAFMFSGDGVPKHLRHLVRDLDAMGDGTGRSLVRRWP